MWVQLRAQLHTTLSESGGDDYEVVAIGTGTTCLGESQMRKDGLILHDNHAEVIARRSFIRYLYHEILSTWQSTKTSTIFNKTNDGKCCLKSGGSFHFYTSNTPCGDATIFPISQPLNQTQSKGVKRKCEQVKLNPEKKVCIHETADEIEQATTQTQSDINRTGAKCVAGENSDRHGKGINYHCVGSLRTKPGRGERTTSMSCSDKILKWNLMGWQGHLLSLLVSEPIHMKYIIVGGVADTVALKRAFYGRIFKHEKFVSLETKINLHCPLIYKTDTEFRFGKPVFNKKHLKPCGSSLSWCKIEIKSLDVAAKSGFRLGTVKKHEGLPKSSTFISRASLFQLFKDVTYVLPQCSLTEHLGSMKNNSYKFHKLLAEDYEEKWKTVKMDLLQNWISHSEDLDKF
uniref:tRNA-specific adenosine deaminase 1-like isoform X2 n=1 Tax=Ciona intestinalis TaxID=7719 RepID=UPI000EF4E32C|nr:tRNA-specific adenosine deaminase 1-like isoform X2 [Ciona intestinalis]|eukprot:XP_026693019.1 tRNA-specific adenosine deaminase 1-like isoform X2 [Ciona intestinalis]